MGIDNVARNIESPKAVYWSVNKGNDDDYDESSNEDGQAITLTTQLKDQGGEKKSGREYITKLISLEWGEQHGPMLDKKGRVFSMGRSINGVLGLFEREENNKIVINPQQVTSGLPNDEKGDNIIQIKCGRFHSLAVSKRGNIYTWGEGSSCRLGLGFIEKTCATPNQLTPY